MPEKLKDLGVALMGLLICSAPGIGWWLTWWILAPTGIISPTDTVWKVATAVIWVVQIFWWVYVTVDFIGNYILDSHVGVMYN